MRPNYSSNRFINPLNATPERYAAKFASNKYQRSPLINESKMSNIVNYHEIKSNFSKILNENYQPRVTPKVRESRIMPRESIDQIPITRKLKKHHDLNNFGLKGSRSREPKVNKENAMLNDIKKYENSKITVTNESKKIDSYRDRDDRSYSEYRPSLFGGNNLLRVKELENESLRREIENLKDNCTALENRYYGICHVKDELQEKLILSEKNHNSLKRDLLSKYTEIKGLETVVNSILKHESKDKSCQETQRRIVEEDRKSLKKTIESLSFELSELKLQNLKITDENSEIKGQMESKHLEIEKLNSIVKNYQERIIAYYKRSSEFSKEIANHTIKEPTLEVDPIEKGDPERSEEGISFKISIKEDLHKY